MDVFGLGCVLAELWMEGTPPFSLSQLFKYRAGEYSPEPYLAEIEDVEIRVSPSQFTHSEECAHLCLSLAGSDSEYDLTRPRQPPLVRRIPRQRPRYLLPRGILHIPSPLPPLPQRPLRQPRPARPLHPLLRRGRPVRPNHPPEHRHRRADARTPGAPPHGRGRQDRAGVDRVGDDCGLLG